MAPPLARRLYKGWKVLSDARYQFAVASDPGPHWKRVAAMKKAQLRLNEAQRHMDTLLDELRQQREITLHTLHETMAFFIVVDEELGDRGELRTMRIRSTIDLIEIRENLVDVGVEEYYLLPNAAAAASRGPPASSPFLAPDLASLLQRAVQLGDAEAEYAKPKLPPDAAQAMMDRMMEELRTSECLDLYDLEQVHVFLEIRKQLGDCGRLRRLKNKCRDHAMALQMWQVLFENGFEQYFELPPASSVDGT